MLQLCLVVLASYAIVRYVTQERGPANVLGSVRSRVGLLGDEWGRWIGCSYCFAWFPVLLCCVLALYAPAVLWPLAALGGVIFLLDLRNGINTATQWIARLVEELTGG